MLGDDSVILVMNTINGNPNKIPDLLPYDCRQNRNPILFEINKTNFKENEKEDQKYNDFKQQQQRLIDELAGAIKLAARSAIKKIYIIIFNLLSVVKKLFSTSLVIEQILNGLMNLFR